MRIGILGAGQLGRMLALAGYPLGMRFRFFDPSPGAPASHLAEVIRADYDDEGALARFAEGLDAVTFEFENVPVHAAAFLARLLPVHPNPRALGIAQDRLTEKELFRESGLATPEFAPVNTRDEFDAALARIGLPCVVKTRRFGYDGKGQRVVMRAQDAEFAWRALGGRPLIVEGFIPFERELSLLAVRDRAGAVAFWPLVENHHREGILRWSIAPAPGVSLSVEAAARAHVSGLMARLDYVGVLAVEFFEKDGGLLANEMAPRVHNSGHWTIEGAETSQFANHLRAIAGLPVGSCAARCHSAMVNFIGSAPSPAEVLSIPWAAPHFYDKEPRPGRKIGHVTLCADSEEQLRERLAAFAGVMLYDPSRIASPMELEKNIEGRA